MHEMTRDEKRAAIRDLCLVEMTGYPLIPIRELQRRVRESAPFYVPLGMTRQVRDEIVREITTAAYEITQEKGTDNG